MVNAAGEARSAGSGGDGAACTMQGSGALQTCKDIIHNGGLGAGGLQYGLQYEEASAERRPPNPRQAQGA